MPPPPAPFRRLASRSGNPAAIALLLLALAFLAACGRRDTPAEVARREATLIVGNGAEPGSLDPHFASILSDQIIVNALFEGLTLLDESTTAPLPASAESWTESPDRLTWTFRLREGLRWSNGEPLTADDFVQTWRRALDPAVAASNADYLFLLKNAQAYYEGRLSDPAAIGAAAPDTRTLVLALERPTPYLPAAVSLPAWFPLNPRVLAAAGAMRQRDASWTRPGRFVGNGAFTLAEWLPNDRIVLARNPHHREAAGNRLEQLVFRPIENADVEERNFRAGQLHVTFSLPVTKVEGWRAAEPAKVRVDPMLQSNFLRFNTTRPPLDDPRVRRALSLAIDRDELMRTVLRGARAGARSLVPPGTGGYASRAAVATDVAAAKALLAAAGFPEGRGFPVLDLQCRNDEIMPRLAEALQARWERELGIQVTVSSMEQKTWIANQQALAYGISTAAWTADYPDAENFLSRFVADGSYNWTGWKSPEYDALLDQASRAADPAARADILQRAEALLLAESPIAPLHYGAQTYLIDPAIRGWDPAPLVFRRYQKVFFANP
ncbi:MAG TPA: peptide ABC transporter substrate-binding protein [Opitutaceae bacterium]|nr:peptide ABC transporter substrate-binding protein [Opitutaceae bacterium]